MSKEYWLEVAKTTGLSEDQVKVIEALAANDKFANAFVPRPEFSRTLDEKDKTLQKYQSEVQEYYKTELQKAAERQQIVDQATATAQRYRDLYGDLDGGNPAPKTPPAFDTSQFISAEAHKKEMERLEAQTLYVIEKGLECSNDYRDRFGKSLSIPNLKKFAVENNLPIEVAYQKMIQPEVEAAQNKTFEEKLKAAREEGAREAMSRANVPIDTRPKESSPFLSHITERPAKDATPPTVTERVNSFAEAWNSAGTAKS